MRIRARDIRLGEKLPWWAGIAYYDFARDIAIVYPVPLNWLVRWARAIYYAMKIPRDRYYWEKREAELVRELAPRWQEFNERVNAEARRQIQAGLDRYLDRYLDR